MGVRWVVISHGNLHARATLLICLFSGFLSGIKGVELCVAVVDHIRSTNTPYQTSSIHRTNIICDTNALDPRMLTLSAVACIRITVFRRASQSRSQVP